MGKIKQSSVLVKKAGLFTLGAFIPGFLRIHWRYLRNNLRAWVALFVAPFMAIKLSLIALVGWFASDTAGVWKFDLIAIFSVALCFFLAERHRGFRKVYVYVVPAVMAVCLLYWAGSDSGVLNAGFAVKAILIGLLTYRVGKFTITKGYEQLTEGADKDYHQGRLHYDRGDYELALPFLEKAAKRGHFKSLYLLGEAYELGHHYDKDIVKAARHFLRAGKKGYAKANQRHESLLGKMTTSEQKQAERNIL